jgi:hypothetical protein
MRRYFYLLFALAACSREPAEPPIGTSTSTSTPAPTPTRTATAPATAGRDLPLLWDDPPTFVRGTPKSPARAAEYVVARAGSDPEDAECVVMTFGSNQGGGVEDNVKRWLGQFQPAAPNPRRTTMEVSGMHATLVETAGTFSAAMMPGRQGATTPTSKPGWRMIGAIIEAPSGLWFFKLTGPDLTVRTAAKHFEDMVRSARPR